MPKGKNLIITEIGAVPEPKVEPESEGAGSSRESIIATKSRKHTKRRHRKHKTSHSNSKSRESLATEEERVGETVGADEDGGTQECKESTPSDGRCRLSSYSNLTIEGGGVLGIAYIGALQEIFEDGSIDSFQCFAGSSAGSLVALMLACGADLGYMIQKIRDLDLNEFKDRTWMGADILRLLRKYGFYRGDRLAAFIEEITEEMTGCKHPTFMQIFNKTGKRLVVTGANINTFRVTYFSLETHPNMSVAKAVRISCSIPYFFRPIKYMGDYYVDGGILDNYPIHYFDKKGFINTETLGLKLISNEDLRLEAGGRLPISNLKDFSANLLSCLQHQAQKVHVREEDWDRTIRIHTGDLSYIDFDLTEEEKIALIDAGREAVRKYIRRGSKRIVHCSCCSHSKSMY